MNKKEELFKVPALLQVENFRLSSSDFSELFSLYTEKDGKILGLNRISCEENDEAGYRAIIFIGEKEDSRLGFDISPEENEKAYQLLKQYIQSIIDSSAGRILEVMKKNDENAEMLEKSRLTAYTAFTLYNYYGSGLGSNPTKAVVWLKKYASVSRTGKITLARAYMGIGYQRNSRFYKRIYNRELGEKFQARVHEIPYDEKF